MDIAVEKALIVKRFYEINDKSLGLALSEAVSQSNNREKVNFLHITIFDPTRKAAKVAHGLVKAYDSGHAQE